MEFVDQSVLYRRKDGEWQSGTIVHFSTNHLVLEIYGSGHEIRLNEVYDSVRVLHGEALFYNGRGVVSDLVEASSTLLLVFYLPDSCIAVAPQENEADMQFACEQFLTRYVEELKLPMRLQQHLFQFADELSQILLGLRGSCISQGVHLTEANGRRNDLNGESQPWRERPVILSVLEHVQKRFLRLNHYLKQCGETERVQVGAFFKRHLFPLSSRSRLFRYFHSARRSFYFNHELLCLLQSEQLEDAESTRGQLLDAFFKATACFEMYEQRCLHWVAEIRDQLNRQPGTLRLLMLGTDLTPELLTRELSAAQCSRIHMDVYCMPDECEASFVQRMDKLSQEGHALPGIRLIRQPIRTMHAGYFQQVTGEFGTYHRILSTSLFESLSEKSAAYLLGFCAQLLEERGELQIFVSPPVYCPVREHWLLWFGQNCEIEAWKRYLPLPVRSEQRQLPYGHLTVFGSTSATS